MFTNNKTTYPGNDKVLIEAACLSTDTKPTTGIANGSTCIEMDTGATFMFNEEGSEWEELPDSSGSGGGGGGSSDSSTAQVTISGLEDNEVIDLYVLLELEGKNYFVPAPNGTWNVVLYQGSISGSLGYSISEVTLTGDATAEEVDDYTVITITGDCTITIS